MTALHNIEAEAQLLGALMQDNRQFEGIADSIGLETFAEPIHGEIFSAIAREISAGRSASPIALKGYFDGHEGLARVGGMGYIVRLVSDVGLYPIRDLAAILSDLAQRRQMREGLGGAADACLNIQTPLAEIIAQADLAVASKADNDIHQPSFADAIDELLQSYNDDKAGVTCRQIPSLDDLIGPIRPKQMMILAGRPGMGKTAVSLSYALGAARAGHGVLFVSLEMSSTQLAGRMLSDLCFNDGEGIPYSAIRDGDLNEWQRNRIAKARAYAAKLPFRIIDAGALTIGRLRMLVRRYAKRMAADGVKLDLVVVDYLGLMSSERKGAGIYETVSEVSRGLKSIAKDEGVAMLALAQLSRTVEQRPDKRPLMSDLRDSGTIEQDADTILFLLRQEYYLQNERPEDQSQFDAWQSALDAVRGRIEFILAKRRDGETGTAVGEFHGAYQAVRG